MAQSRVKNSWLIFCYPRALMPGRYPATDFLLNWFDRILEKFLCRVKHPLHFSAMYSGAADSFLPGTGGESFYNWDKIGLVPKSGLRPLPNKATPEERYECEEPPVGTLFGSNFPHQNSCSACFRSSGMTTPSGPPHRQLIASRLCVIGKYCLRLYSPDHLGHISH
mgnify:FL=1